MSFKIGSSDKLGEILPEKSSPQESPKPQLTFGDVGEKCWLEEPSSLLQDTTLIPRPGMTNAERLNSLTRLILAIAVILFFFPIGSWWIFLIFGIGLIVFLYYSMRSSKLNNYRIVENYRCFSRLRLKHKRNLDKPRLTIRSR